MKVNKKRSSEHRNILLRAYLVAVPAALFYHLFIAPTLEKEEEEVQKSSHASLEKRINSIQLLLVIVIVLLYILITKH
jgi:uncharacterized membrane protein